MGYYNLIYQNGENNFLKNCKNSGVDGLIIVDLPCLNKILLKSVKENQLVFVQLLLQYFTDGMKKLSKTHMI